ncbi:hypothetical protein Cme02nite_38960 [Catellatospora methionotrophica]|uniref:Uncharacterized protein n=1 Tax=Catellatospora methionotrophica TaxID=121620 RepID=A0A8J3LHC9_9ACTN|nr:hypothetical protein [Catellatospora methionotrophica]GIG15564.1 hypothetical protein Cme02nite_38960 [Catellatospora methionotrophica]
MTDEPAPVADEPVVTRPERREPTGRFALALVGAFLAGSVLTCCAGAALVAASHAMRHERMEHGWHDRDRWHDRPEWWDRDRQHPWPAPVPPGPGPVPPAPAPPAPASPRPPALTPPPPAAPTPTPSRTP